MDNPNTSYAYQSFINETNVRDYVNYIFENDLVSHTDCIYHGVFANEYLMKCIYVFL